MFVRVWCASFALPLLACFLISTSDAQERDSTQYSVKLRALQQQRLDALQKRYDGIKMRYDGGSGAVNFEVVSAALDDLLKAKADVVSSNQERIDICRQRIDNLRALEDHKVMQLKTGEALGYEAYAATAARLQAEIECLRLEFESK